MHSCTFSLTAKSHQCSKVPTGFVSNSNPNVKSFLAVYDVSSLFEVTKYLLLRKTMLWSLLSLSIGRRNSPWVTLHSDEILYAVDTTLGLELKRPPQLILRVHEMYCFNC